jgi:hypothetical protein
MQRSGISTMTPEIVRCASCDGYGWFEEDGITADCDWCGGIGYMYRDAESVDHRIPASDYAKVADTLERLEAERMREMGYSGTAKHPNEQDIRRQQSSGDASE